MNLHMQNDLQRLKDDGIFLCAEGMKPILANSQREYNQMAMDVDPFNPTSNGVPSQFTTIYVNMLVDQIFAKRGFFEIAPPFQQGDWTTEQAKFAVRGLNGSTQPYSDFSNKGKAGVNFTWVPRDIYRFESTIQYGDLETAVMDSAKLDLVGSKRMSIATIIAIAFNRMGFFGNINTSGTFLSKTYGLLNDPNLPAATAVANGASGSPLWVNKTPEEIYNDVVSAMATMENQTGNNNSQTDPYVLALDGFSAIQLNRGNQFNVTAYDMLKKNFANLRVVISPEYQTILGFQLICEKLMGQDTVKDLFTYKYRSHGVMRYDSWFNEKVSAGSGGAAIILPLAIVTKTGIES